MKHYFLPLFSGVGLGALFYFPTLWVLVFIALAPLIFFLERYGEKPKTIFAGIGLMICTMNLIGLVALWPTSHFASFLKENILYQAPAWTSSSYALNLGFFAFLLFFTVWFAIPHVLILGGGCSLWRKRQKDNHAVRPSALAEFLLVPSLWVLSEFGRSIISGGFTFGHIGYRVIDFLPLAIMSRLWGVYGLGFVVVLINVVIAWMVAKRSLNQALTIAVVVGAVMVVGFFWSRSEMQQGWQGQSLKAVVVHGVNSVMSSDNDALRKEIESENDLILFPNTVGDPLFSSRTVLEQTYFTDLLKEKSVRVIIAGHDFIELGRRYNTMIAWGENGPEGMYRKRVLFPFGEYFPILETLFPQTFLSIKRYSPWPGRHGVLQTNLGKLGVTICQEINMPGLIRSDILAGAELLVNGGSEWQFGRYAQEEQLRIAKMRALESSRFFIRAMKTGTSAIINPLGQVTAKPNMNQDAELLEGEVKLLKGETPYIRYGDGAVLLFLALIAILGFASVRPAQRDET